MEGYMDLEKIRQYFEQVDQNSISNPSVLPEQISMEAGCKKSRIYKRLEAQLNA
jgi:hypothetical protein